MEQVDRKQNKLPTEPEKHSKDGKDPPKLCQQHRCREIQDKLPKPEGGNVSVQGRRESIKNQTTTRRDFTQGSEAVSPPQDTCITHTKHLVSYLLRLSHHRASS